MQEMNLIIRADNGRADPNSPGKFIFYVWAYPPVTTPMLRNSLEDESETTFETELESEETLAAAQMDEYVADMDWTEMEIESELSDVPAVCSNEDIKEDIVTDVSDDFVSVCSDYSPELCSKL